MEEDNVLRRLDFSHLPCDGNSVQVDGRFFISDNIDPVELSGGVPTMDFPVQINDMTIVCLCLAGEATVAVNLNEYRMVNGMMMFILPGNIFQIKSSSSDFSFLFMAVAVDFIGVPVNAPFTMKIIKHILATPYCCLAPNEAEEFVAIYKMMKHKLMQSDFRYKKEVAANYMSVMLYNSYLYFPEESKAGADAVSRQEDIFNKFIRAVEKNYMRERNVKYYADILCISPKYLSTVIHRVSGKYATEWIDNYVILESKALLRGCGMSVKEVCHKLNFPNQSFFAKYFKHHTGLTPREYKNS